MPEAIQHNLIDPSVHLAVLADHQPREAAYRTLYDDGTAGETTHMLYWDAADEEVHSCPIEEWAAISQLPEVGDPPA